MIMEILNICMNKGCQVWSVKEGYRLVDDIQSKVLDNQSDHIKKLMKKHMSYMQVAATFPKFR